MDFLTVSEFSERARRILPQVTGDKMWGTESDSIGRTNARNEKAFDTIDLRTRVLVDISKRSLSTEVLGQSVALPILLAPVGGLKRYHPEGELASARAAVSAGTVMGLSTSASTAMEDVAKVGGPLWFQLYVMKDPRVSEILVKRAEKANFRGLIVTVDDNSRRLHSREGAADYTGLRNEDKFANFRGIDLSEPITTANYQERKSLSFAWSDLKWLRSITSMPLIVKGVTTAEDALLCVDHGVDAIIVSNHGGHGLPGSIGSVSMLGDVTAAVGGRIEVYLDGGIRKGTDVLKALALGARAVLIGRPLTWGLTVDGERGVLQILRVLQDELDIAMGHCGIADIRKINRSFVRATHSADPAQSLATLAGLFKQGLLTEKEFAASKSMVIGSSK